MHAVNYRFNNLDELSHLLDRAEEDHELELPDIASGVNEGDWLVATFAVGEQSTTVATQVTDRGNGPRLTLNDRDWHKLQTFAQRGGPRVVPTTVPPPPNSELIPDLSARVLLIDADLDTQAVIEALLRAGGHRTTAVASAEQAFDELRAEPHELILLEWRLPGLSGVEFCRRIRKDRRIGNIPLAFLSIHADEARVVEAFEAGADDYITKPFRAQELSARVVGLLRRSRMPARTH